MKQQVFLITPVAKPRATRKDKWNPSKAVLKYRAFADECRLKKVPVPESYAKFIFYMPMPVKSWSEKKRIAMDGEPHLQTPDGDNLIKALFDAIHKQDSHIWNFTVEKRWSRHGMIIVQHHSFDDI